MDKDLKEIAAMLAALSALKGGKVGIAGAGPEGKIARLCAWLIKTKFDGKLVLSADEMKEMEELDEISLMGIGDKDKGITFTVKPIGERSSEDDDDDTCECGRCKNCGQKHD